jgi:hypothetical protein
VVVEHSIYVVVSLRARLLRIPLMPIKDSIPSRSEIPFDADHEFHSMAIKPEQSDAVFSL